jgi:hypothetical protein
MSKQLTTAVKKTIVQLSLHPAGCEDWRYYEQLCLDAADKLMTALMKPEADNE